MKFPQDILVSNFTLDEECVLFTVTHLYIISDQGRFEIRVLTEFSGHEAETFWTDIHAFTKISDLINKPCVQLVLLAEKNRCKLLSVKGSNVLFTWYTDITWPLMLLCLAHTLNYVPVNLTQE